MGADFFVVAPFKPISPHHVDGTSRRLCQVVDNKSIVEQALAWFISLFRYRLSPLLRHQDLQSPCRQYMTLACVLAILLQRCNLMTVVPAVTPVFFAPDVGRIARPIDDSLLKACVKLD